jgi:aldose 1-epimerase
VLLKEEGTGTEIAILPAYGASLHAFRIRQGDRVFNVIDHYEDLATVQREMGKSFKSPKLSPFPCRIAGGIYDFEGATHTFSNLFSDGNAIHGLLYDKAFTVSEESANETAASLVLQYVYKKEEPAYPYLYSCTVKYTLRPGNLLELQTTVANLDKVPIPLADGWHPYFQLGGKVNDWLLQFHADSILEFNEALIPTGKQFQYEEFESPRVIGDRFLDNCFVLKPGIENAACELFNPANGLRVSFFPDAAYPYLQIYTPSERRSIAIENLSGAPDCFNNKMGLLQLLPEHSQIFTVKYKAALA